MSRPRKRNDCRPSSREPFRELPNGYCKRPPLDPSPSPCDELILSRASASSLSDDHPDYVVSPLVPAGPITTSQPGFPTYEQYKRIEGAYLANLAPRKRAKALITQATFDQIWEVLWHPGSTRVGTPQFRFWVRKMFRLVNVQGGNGGVSHARRPSRNNTENGTNLKGKRGKGEDLPPVVLHDNRPVAIMEQMYEVLCYCHGLTEHGGRDKTCAVVREHYSWVPKELVAKFVKGCPTCLTKKAGNLQLEGMPGRASDWVSKEVKQEERAGAGNSGGGGGGGLRSIGRPTAGLTGSYSSSVLKASILRRPNDENMPPTVPRLPGGSACNPFPSASQSQTADFAQKNNAGLLANNHPVPCSLNTPVQPPPNATRPIDTLRYYGYLTSGNNIWNSAGLPPLREALLASAIHNRSCTLRKPSALNDVDESLPPTLQHLLITRPVHHHEPVAPLRYIDPAKLSLSRMEGLPTNEITPPLRTSTPVSRDVNRHHAIINPSIGPAIFNPWNWATDANEIWSTEPPIPRGPDNTLCPLIPFPGWM